MFLYYKEQIITCRETENISNRYANMFKSLNIDITDRVGIMLPNCSEFLYSWFGLSKLGEIEVLININNRKEGLLDQLRYFSCQGLVIEARFLSVLEEIKDQLGFLNFIIVLDQKEKG